MRADGFSVQRKSHGGLRLRLTRPTVISAGARRNRGFTLVELIAVIVVLGILSVGLGNIIGDATRGYLNTNATTELAQIGRFALERMSRELRNALPGSIDVYNSGTDQCIRFNTIVDSSRYLTLPLPPALASNSFTAVDFGRYGNVNGLAVAVNAITPANFSASTLTNISAAVDGVVTLTLANPTLFPEPSVQQRFYLIENAQTSFCVTANNTLERNGVLLAQFVQPAQGGGAPNIFAYNPGSLRRGAMVTINLRLATPQGLLDNEIIPFSHTVFIRNVP